VESGPYSITQLPKYGVGRGVHLSTAPASTDYSPFDVSDFPTHDRDRQLRFKFGLGWGWGWVKARLGLTGLGFSQDSISVSRELTQLRSGFLGIMAELRLLQDTYIVP
jgi:hypothetical protein